MPIAAMANVVRRMVRCGLNVLANAWVSFFVPQLVCSEKCLFRNRRSAPPHENSNNPLAVNPESENDAGRWNFYYEILLRLKRRLPATTNGFLRRKKDLFK
jgi:hypothetical protein